ncbi:MAG: error-prone DNA polymerase [Paracoccus denitrificans]|nr:MAG: error-prone DNA polymerase [Paracoccus denitrificans]PZO85279.1 MAG: error-prone DNA polymerase [Paracoccus denitrificans]
MPDSDQHPPRLRLTGDYAPNPRAPFVELGVTSAFSFLRGASDATELAAAAHVLGYDAIGIADLNSLAGVVRLHTEARRAALRPIIGARIVLTCGTGFLAYPRDRAAYGRLSTLISKGRRHDTEGRWQAKGICDLTLDDLEGHGAGLSLVWLPGDDLSVLPDLAARLPGLGHVAASFLYRGDDVARINRLDRAARAAGLSILATNDVHYHVPDRRPLQDVMTCIRHGTTIDQAGFLLNANAERHLKTPGEMVRLFARWPHAIRASRDLADQLTFSLSELAYEYPRETAPPGRDPMDYLAEVTWESATTRYPDGIPDKVRAALTHELTMIGKKKIAQYFLTIREIVNFARSKGILCQGRGSAANSAVCFVLGITPVDPAHFDLLFERFISEDRDEPPDIDVDFEHERREEVIQFIYDKFGRDRAALCATVIHYRPRSAIREVGRAMGLSDDITGALARTVWGSWGTDMGASEAGEAGVDLSDLRLRRTLALAQQMIGMPRHLSQHVGGFILTEGLLTETVPIGNGAMPERSFIEWDKDDIDALGILKVDVLALGMLTCIRKCFDLIDAHHGRQLTLADLNPDAPDAAPVFEMLCQGDSVGVFQVESRAQMNMLPRMKPRRFYDLVIEVAIVRPGPIQGDMVHPYLRRRNDEEPVEYPRPGPEHPFTEMEDILKRTLGVPIFQEQAMKIAMVAAQFDPKKVNELRKAMATFRSRGTIEALQDDMVGGMTRRGYDPVFARRCFDQIKGFGEYGFPESHAAAFAHLVYVSAWLKHYYPAAFAAALLNSQPMGFYAPAQIVRDARAHGVQTHAVDVNYSEWDNTLEPVGGDVALRLGLRQIEGLAQKQIERMLAERDQPFTGLADLQMRAGLDAGSIRRLAAGDAFRSAGLDRRAALWDAKALRDAPDLPLFRQHDDEGSDLPVILPPMPVSEQVVADYQTMRLSLKAHPMRFLRRSMTAQGYIPASQLPHARHGQSVQLAGLVLIRQRPGSAKGVCFITLEDETATANLVVWPKVFDAFRKVIMTARIIDVQGRVQMADGVIHVVANRLTDRSDVLWRIAGETFATPMSRADEVNRPIPASRQSHPRDTSVIPKSRDFH